MIKTVKFKSIISTLLCASMLLGMQPLSASNHDQKQQQSYSEWTKNGIEKGARFVWDHKVEISVCVAILVVLYFGFRNSGGDAQSSDKLDKLSQDLKIDIDPEANKVLNVLHELARVKETDPSKQTKFPYPFAHACKAIQRNNKTYSYESIVAFIHFGGNLFQLSTKEKQELSIKFKELYANYQPKDSNN